MILVGGANVYPAEVEGALSEHPAVADVCVIGIPDDDLGNVPHAIISENEPVTDDELRDHLRQRLSPYKIPAHVRAGRRTAPRRRRQGSTVGTPG